jgi:CBS domain-containing protein
MLSMERTSMTVEQALKRERLGSLPLSSPACVPCGTSLEETLRLMRNRGVGCVLVCDGEALAGIFTERDVLNKLIGSGVSESEAVDRYMTRNPTSLTSGHTLGDAVRLMTEHGYRHIPLLDEGGRRTGLVAARDIVNYIAEHFPAEVVNLPPRLHQVFKTPEGA